MAELTIDRLKDILRISAGEDESEQLAGDIGGTTFGELGYDSLALLETAALIKREFGVDITDDMEHLNTPQAITDFVNGKSLA